MCKLNKHNNGRIIDPCMRELIRWLKWYMQTYQPIACCCGHGKYPMTIICKHEDYKSPVWEIVSGTCLYGKKFYKKDKEGYYYIPEVIKNDGY